MISILGASGSGKSTFLRCINLLETPDQGIISVNGEVIEMKQHADGRQTPSNSRQVERMRSCLGMVFQSFNLWSHMTVLQNVIEVRLRKSGGCAVKDYVLTWRYLALCLKGRRRQPEREGSVNSPDQPLKKPQRRGKYPALCLPREPPFNAPGPGRYCARKSPPRYPALHACRHRSRRPFPRRA
ncbi:ABC-type histidine transport system, ATPase component [Pseudomonas sp. GM49]|nr:ABC-type histidine transport system, ATPase component [Pseudomonas sp. GM49]